MCVDRRGCQFRVVLVATGRCETGWRSAKVLGFHFSTSDKIYGVCASGCTSTPPTPLHCVLCYVITLFFFYSHDSWCCGR